MTPRIPPSKGSPCYLVAVTINNESVIFFFFFFVFLALSAKHGECPQGWHWGINMLWGDRGSDNYGFWGFLFPLGGF